MMSDHEFVSYSEIERVCLIVYMWKQVASDEKRLCKWKINGLKTGKPNRALLKQIRARISEYREYLERLEPLAKVTIK